MTRTAYEHLTGALSIYVALYGAAEPAVTATPGAPWRALGVTNGDQKIAFGGELRTLRAPDAQGPSIAIREEETLGIELIIVTLTLEDWAQVMGNAEPVTYAGNPDLRRVALLRGQIPTEYALLLRGAFLSPYGAYPGQFYIPRGVWGGEPAPTFGKNRRAQLAVRFEVLEDPRQRHYNDRFGWPTVQVEAVIP